MRQTPGYGATLTRVRTHDRKDEPEETTHGCLNSPRGRASLASDLSGAVLVRIRGPPVFQNRHIAERHPPAGANQKAPFVQQQV